MDAVRGFNMLGIKGSPIISLVAISFIIIAIPNLGCVPKPSLQSLPRTSASFQISKLSITPAEAKPGDNVTITAEVSNTGGTEGGYTAVLTINGIEVDKKAIILAPNSSMTITFSKVETKAGKYLVGIGNLSVSLLVNDVDGLYLEKIYSIPSYIKTDPAYGGFPGGGEGYCVPVSISNSLMWLSNNGFPNLASHSRDRKKDQHDIAYLLGSYNYMNTSTTTTLNNLCRGLKRYILEKGYSYKRLEYQGIGSVDSEYRTGKTIPDLEWIKLGIRGYASAWLQIGWYTYNPSIDEYTSIGGHMLTLAGYGHDGKSPNPNYLITHDTSARAGTAIANQYILPVSIHSGRLKGKIPGNLWSAEGFYKMTGGLCTMAGADFGILDGAIVLEMQP